jgi:hypothetical protein
MKNKKQLKRRMNSTAMLSFYNSRSLRGDNSKLSELTGYSESHISNVKSGRRSIPLDLANEMYYMSRKRVKQTA